MVLSGSLTTWTTISWPGLQQVGDVAAVAAGAATAAGRLDARAARSRRRAGSRSCRARCRRTRPRGRRGRCRPRPCRCCRRSSGRRGARGRARRRCSRRRDWRARGGGAALRGRPAGRLPVASSSATRVSPRSTLTSTCFFNCVSPFDCRQLGRGNAVAAASLSRPPSKSAPGLARRRHPRLHVDRLQQTDGHECDEHR